jgi:hypothetical protein
VNDLATARHALAAVACLAAAACGQDPAIGMTGSMDKGVDEGCLRGAFDALRDRRVVSDYEATDNAGSGLTILDSLLPGPSVWSCEFRRHDEVGHLVLTDDDRKTAVLLTSGRPGSPMGRAEAVPRMSWLDDVWNVLRERCPRPLATLSKVKRVCEQAECDYPKDKRISGEGPEKNVLGRPFKLKRR